MILSVGYSEVENTGARGIIDGRNIDFFLRVRVDETNIIDAIERFHGKPSIVSLDYEGDVSLLGNIDLKDMLVIVTRQQDTLDINTDMLMAELGNKVRVVIKLPFNYSDMKKVKEYSEKYSNLFFCGGHFIRLDGLNLGCIGVEDIPKKIPESRLSLVTQRCSCVLKNFSVEDVEELEFYEYKVKKAKSRPKPKTSRNHKTSTEKKQTSRPKKKGFASILGVDSGGSTDNF